MRNMTTDPSLKPHLGGPSRNPYPHRDNYEHTQKVEGVGCWVGTMCFIPASLLCSGWTGAGWLEPEPVSDGHVAPVWTWADEGNKSKPHQPTEPDKDFSPTHWPSDWPYEFFKRSRARRHHEEVI